MSEGRICKICGKPIAPDSHRMKYCSEKCAKEGHDIIADLSRKRRFRARDVEMKPTKKVKAPYEWLDEINRVLKKNGGVYYRKGD